MNSEPNQDLTAQLNSMAELANHMQNVASNLIKTHTMLLQQQPQTQSQNHKKQGSRKQRKASGSQNENKNENIEVVVLQSGVFPDDATKLQAIRNVSEMLRNDYDASLNQHNSLMATFDQDQENVVPKENSDRKFIPFF